MTEPDPRPNDPRERREPELFRRYPALSHTPWVALLDAPTPVEPAPKLGNLAGARRLFVKRDDISARPYAGGKPRKLEFLLGEALASGATRVVTWGGVGSNQAVATAAHAARLGLRTTLLLLPQKSSPRVRENLLADVCFGATLRLVQSQARAATLAGTLDAYAIPIGGSSPLGNLGFVNAAFELDRQISAGELPEPDRLYIPMGTMGSAVGLSIGLRAAGRKTLVVAVRASNLGTSSAARFRQLFERTVAYLVERDPTFPHLEFSQAGVELDGSELGGGYAVPTNRARHAVEVARELGHWQLETTYTGKALASLLADASSHAGQVVLFWNTHNSLALPIENIDPEQVPPEFRVYMGRAR